MMSYTKDGQIPPELVKSRDERSGISTESRRELRKSYLPPYEPVEGGDMWEKSNKAIVFEAVECDLKT